MTDVSPADRVVDLINAWDALSAIEPPVYGAQADLLCCALVVTDERQYSRAAAHGLAGRVGEMRFESVLFDGVRFRLAMFCEDQRGAEVAFLVPATNTVGEVVDIIAWVPESGRTAMLHGDVGTLGLWSLGGPLIAPPILHESLLAWFRADAPGLFVVDEKLAAAELEGVTMGAIDRPAALRLHARLASHSRKPPQIVVPRSDARRAG